MPGRAPCVLERVREGMSELVVVPGAAARDLPVGKQARVRESVILAPSTHWLVAASQSPRTVSELLEIVLRNRGIAPEDTARFLAPPYEGGFTDPLLLPQCAPAVARIRRALREQEPIAVFGDYDVDGVTGAALLGEALESLHGRVQIDLPHREDGYGLSIPAVHRLVPPARLLMTVDNGTSARAAIAEAIARGADVIVVDHHLVSGALPAGALVVNPALPSSRYPGPVLSAVGVAWKLVAALFTEEGRAGQEKYLLDLVCLGTLADSVELRGENRSLVRWGLEVLRHTRRPGLRALAEQARCALVELTAEDVIFRLVPRLNAAGRLRHADVALSLLRAADDGSARRLARDLDEVNTERRLLAEEILAEATQKLPADLPSVLVAAGPWPLGLLGIIASRLAEQFHRPAVAIAVRDEECVASVRGDGINVVELVRETEGLLTRFGGHHGAAGFSFPKSALDNVTAFFLQHAPLTTLAGKPSLQLDCVLPKTLLTLDLSRTLKPLEPFGAGNERPLFLVPGLSVLESRAIGTSGDHLRLVLQGLTPGRGQTAVAFRWGQRLRPQPGERIDLAVEVHVDAFRGVPRLDLHVRDLRTAEDG